MGILVKKKARIKFGLKKKPKSTGVSELVKKIKSRMTAEEIDDQLKQLREE